MSPRTGDLYFEDPPICEVACSVQFEPMEEFHLGLMGLLWGNYRSRFPTVEADNELPHTVEKFGVIQKRDVHRIKLLESLPTPRFKFVTNDGQYLIQVQKDRFVLNWRKLENENFGYPRYVQLKQRFLNEFEILTSFLKDNGLPDPLFNQVELTYVNHIDASDRLPKDVFNDIVCETRFSESLDFETFSTNLQHLIKDAQGGNLGRIYTTIQKANRIKDGASLFVLQFVARTHPVEKNLNGVIEVMDIMRDAINASFVALTTEKMHSQWRGHGA